MKRPPTIGTVRFAFGILAVSLLGCDAPTAPVLENPYDFEYTGGPFDYSLELLSDRQYVLSWRDNSDNGRRYIMTRRDVNLDNSETALDVTLEDRSIQDELPGEATVYEYAIDLARAGDVTTNTWTIVSYGIERYFSLTSELPTSNTVFNSLTVDGNTLLSWTPQSSKIWTRDMRLTEPPLPLENNLDVRTASHHLRLSADRTVVCSQLTFETNSFEDIRCWSAVTGEALLDVERPNDNTFSLNRSGYLAIFGDTSIEWWRFSDGQLESTVSTLPGHPEDITTDGSVAFVTDPARPGQVLPYILETNQLLDKPIDQQSVIESPDGRILATCSRLSKGVTFYDAAVLLDPGTTSNGFLGVIPDAIDCSFSPDMTQVVTYYSPVIIDGGLMVFDVNDLDQLTFTQSRQDLVNIADLYLPARFNITDVEWLPGNRLFTSGPIRSVHEWSLTPRIDVAVTDTFLFDR